MKCARFFLVLSVLFLQCLLGCSKVSPTPLATDPREIGSSDQTWPQWRGPNCQGIARGANPPISFTPTDALWRTRLPATGNSSPVVWKNRIYLTGQIEATTNTELAVLCLDRANGQVLWQYKVGKARGRTHRKNGYASATVACDAGHIVAAFPAVGLFCFDPKGNLLWRTSFDSDGVFPDHQWGLGASPIIFDDKVVLLCDSETKSFLAVFALDDGSCLMHADRPPGNCWATPVLVHPKGSGKPVLVINGSGWRDTSGLAMIAAYLLDGTLLWKFPGATELSVPTPMVAGDLVVCTSGRNGPIVAFRVLAENRAVRHQLLWMHRRGGPYIPTGLLYRNRLFLVDDSGILRVFDPATGRRLSQLRLRGPFTASLVAAAGRIYAVNERGTVFVISAETEPRVIAQNSLNEPCLATPAIVGTQLIIRTRDNLYCFDSAKGKQPPMIAINRSGQSSSPAR